MNSLSLRAVMFLLLLVVFARGQDSVDELDMKGHAAYDAEKYQAAIDYWSRALKIDPKNIPDYYNRANAWLHVEERDKAIADFTEVIRLDPKEGDAYEFRGNVHFDKGEADLALADYDEALKLKPKAAAEIYRYRGDANGWKGALDAALADYAEALRLDPRRADARFLRAGIYYNRGEWEKAVAEFSKEIEVSGADYSNLCNRSEAYLGAGQWDKALADATAALKLKADYVPALILRGKIHSAQGDYEKAAADFDDTLEVYFKSIQPPVPNPPAMGISNTIIFAPGVQSAPVGNPDDSRPYAAAAWFYATCPKVGTRNGARAVELAMKACEVAKWNDASALDALAAACAEAGKWDDAVKCEKMAVQAGTAARLGINVHLRFGEIYSEVPDEKTLKAYSARLLLYEQKKAYREEKK